MKAVILGMALLAVGCGSEFSAATPSGVAGPSAGGSGGASGSGGLGGEQAAGSGGTPYTGGLWLDCSSGELAARGIEGPLSELTVTMATDLWADPWKAIPDTTYIGEGIGVSGVYESKKEPPLVVVTVTYPTREEVIRPEDVLTSGLLYYDATPGTLGSAEMAPLLSCSIAMSGETIAEWP